MGEREHGEVKCGGLWVQAKNNLHLGVSPPLCADLKNVCMLVQLLFLYLLYSYTHLGS